MQVGGLFQSPLLLGTPSRYVTLSAEVTLHISVAQDDGRGWGGEESGETEPGAFQTMSACTKMAAAASVCPRRPPHLPHRPRRLWASEG